MQWKAPYIITECKGESNYCIEIDKMKIFHIDLLKHYIKRKKDEGISEDTGKDLGWNLLKPVMESGKQKRNNNELLSGHVAIKRRTSGMYTLKWT